MFSTYSFSIWSMLSTFYFGQVDIVSICNHINYSVGYTLALVMDGAPIYPLWLKRVLISLLVLNMIVQLAFMIQKDAFHGELCVNASLCVSPAEIAFYRCVCFT